MQRVKILVFPKACKTKVIRSSLLITTKGLPVPLTWIACLCFDIVGCIFIECLYLNQTMMTRWCPNRQLSVFRVNCYIYVDLVFGRNLFPRSVELKPSAAVY